MGAEGFRRKQFSAADLFPAPKAKEGPKEKHTNLLIEAVKRELETEPEFSLAFERAFLTTRWKSGLPDDELGEYASIVHDYYGKPYRPQDKWFTRDIAPHVAKDRERMDREAGDFPGQAD